MRKIRLNALIFSIDEYLDIENWHAMNRNRFKVTMPQGIACAPLTSVIYHPDILSSTTGGVLIADHRNYSEDKFHTVVRQLRLRKKQLYSVTNGIEPLDAPVKEFVREPVTFGDTPIVKILKDCRPVLRWLDECGPTRNLPDKYEEPVKRLEKLGFVFRRNNKTFSLRRHRLRKVLAHESKKLTAPFGIEDLLYA